MKIFIGADHAGFGLKEKLTSYLKENGHEVVDKGAFEYNENDDYPDFIIPVAREVSMHPNEVRGIIIGGSGQGEAMTANKLRGVRAAVFYHNADTIIEDDTGDIITISREHNNSNILSVGARFVREEEVIAAVKKWLDTPFKDIERHLRRITKMDRINQ